MKLALLGTGAALDACADAVQESTEHAIVWFGADSSHESGSEGWEWLLGGGDCDAVIVGDISGDPQAEDALRKIAQAGHALLLVDPRSIDAIFAYELEMIREESGRPIMPAIPLLESEPYQQFQQTVTHPDESTLGRIDKIVLERSASGANRDEVRSLLFHDFVIAQRLAGRLNRVSAMSPGEGGNSYQGLGVQLAGPGEAMARWSIEPTGEGGLTITALGAAGRAVLRETPTETGTLVQLDAPSGATSEQALSRTDSARAMLAALERACDGTAPDVAWKDVARTIELAAAVDTSLARRRTVELNFDEASEMGAFKGVMTSLGCAVLLASLFVVFVGVTLTGLGVGLLGFWPHALVVMLVSFLLLQSLRFVVPQTAASSSTGNAPPPAGEPHASPLP